MNGIFLLADRAEDFAAQPAFDTPKSLSGRGPFQKRASPRFLERWTGLTRLKAK